MGNTVRTTIDRVMKRVTISAKMPLPLKRKQELFDGERSTTSRTQPEFPTPLFKIAIA